MRTILLVSEYAPLLQSRSALLRSIKANTINTSTVEIAKLNNKQFDLLALCHSFRARDSMQMRSPCHLSPPAFPRARQRWWSLPGAECRVLLCQSKN
jgi:hypothetical protein